MLKLGFVIAAAALSCGCATSTEPSARPGAEPVAFAAAPQCLRETGSRILPRPGECLPVPGRSFTRDDLQRTGELDSGRALNRLLP